MKSNLRTLIICTLIGSVVFALAGWSSDSKDVPCKPARATVEQQSICHGAAEKRFEVDKQVSGQLAASSFTSHFDPGANVCYLRHATVWASTPNYMAETVVITDAIEGRLYGNYSKDTTDGLRSCEIHVPGKPVYFCKSRTEFNQLADKYFGVAE